MSNLDKVQKQTILPDIGDIIFVLIIQFLIYLVPSFAFGDGSTGWHLVTGNYILNTHNIPHHDLISYTFPNKPWVAYQWLSDLLMAAVTKLGGLNLLGVTIAAANALLSLLLYERCRKEGANFLFALFITICGSFVCAVHWLARPVIFNFFGVFIFATKLEDFYRGKISSRKLIVPLCLYMLIWTNTHPAFLLGIVLISIYLFSSIFNFLRSKSDSRSPDQLKVLAITLLACTAITLLNPYGVQLYAYIANYLQGSTVINATAEFASPIFNGAFQPACLEVLFVLLIIGLAMKKERLSLPRFLYCLVFGHLALTGIRNTPLFAIVALPAIAQLFRSPGIFTFSEKTVLGKVQSKWRSIAQGFEATESQCQLHLIPIIYTLVLVIASLNQGKLFNSEIVHTGFDPHKMPTETLEFIKQNKLDPAKGINYDNWGGYINYKLGMPVFIDDRADFYGVPFYTEYADVSQMSPGWKDVLDKHHIQWLLFPNNSRVIVTLKDNPHWTPVSQDDASTLFVRDPAVP